MPYRIQNNRQLKSIRRRFYLLMALIYLLIILVNGISGYILYSVSLEQTKSRLLDKAVSMSRLIEAVAKFDQINSSTAHPKGASAATLSQVIDAYSSYKGFGETGEFVLGRMEGDEINLFLRFRENLYNRSVFIPLDAKRSLAMRQALANQTGVGEYIDYRGEHTLSAFSYIMTLKIGLVVKMDLAEIREPYLKGFLSIGGISLLLMITITLLFARITTPILHEFYLSNKRNDKLSQAILEIQDNERAVFARELHDNLGSSLVVLKMMLQSFLKKIQPTTTKSTHEILNYMDMIVEDTRSLSHSLSPENMKELGLNESISRLVNRIRKASPNLKINLSLEGFENFFTDHWNTHAYRIVQEALNNVIKHSQAKLVQIVWVGQNKCLIIRDDGIGEGITEKTGQNFGLSVMHERAEAIHATLKIKQIKASGTEVILEFRN